MVKNIAIGTGRRKTAVARVFVRDGSGKIVVNGKDVKDYFSSAEQVQVVNQPLLVTSMGNKYDIVINVTGGGLNGQAAACLHGISRALVQIDPDARTSLKANGYLTRDRRSYYLYSCEIRGYLHYLPLMCNLILLCHIISFLFQPGP